MHMYFFMINQTNIFFLLLSKIQRKKQTNTNTYASITVTKISKSSYLFFWPFYSIFFLFCFVLILLECSVQQCCLGFRCTAK